MASGKSTSLLISLMLLTAAACRQKDQLFKSLPSAKTNIHFTKPCRMEIDVIGANNKLAIVADCKHWKSYSLSSISCYVEKQIRRTKILCRTKGRTNYNISHAIPIILTLYSIDVKFIDGVPISKFKSFIEDVSLYLSEIRVISAKVNRRQNPEHLKL